MIRYTSLLTLLVGFLFLIPLVARVDAATLNFDPTSINVKEGETFEVDVMVDTANAEVYGVDALFQFCLLYTSRCV